MFSSPNFHQFKSLPLSNIFIASGIFLIFTILIYNTNLVFSTPHVTLQLVSPDKNDVYQLFYDTGKGFNETESIQYTVDKSEMIKDVVFNLPISLNQIKFLRFDPGSQATLIKIKSIKLASDGTEYHWNATEILQNFKPAMYINNFSEKNGLLHLNSTGRDPQFISNFDFSIFTPKAFFTINVVHLTFIEGLSYVMVIGVIITILSALLSQKFGTLIELETANFYTCIVLFFIANVIFFYKLQKIIYPFPYYDEFNHFIPSLSAWADGTFTIGQLFKQTIYSRPVLYFIYYFVFVTRLFGENFYSISIYLVYISISIITFIMLFKDKMNRLLWLAILLIIFTSRATELHFWSLPATGTLFWFLSLVGFYLIRLTETRNSGFKYSILIWASGYGVPISFVLMPFFLIYYFFDDKFNGKIPSIVELFNTILTSVKKLDGYFIAVISYFLLVLVYFHRFEEYVPVTRTMNVDFLLSFIGGLFVEMVNDINVVKLLGLILIVMMALLARNLKTILISLAFLAMVLVVTWQRSGFGETYAFQNRYYVYSALVFVILILDAEMIKNKFHKYFLQWIFMLFIVVGFSKWAISDYDVRFSGGKRTAFNAYLNNDFWGTEKTKLVHPSLTEQEWKYFLNTVKHGYFPKPKQ